MNHTFIAAVIYMFITAITFTALLFGKNKFEHSDIDLDELIIISILWPLTIWFAVPYYIFKWIFGER